MREILFSGKRKDNGEWVYGGYFHETLYYGDEVDRHWIIIYGEFDYDNYEAYEVIPESVGEYTGLTDKNGKKIFDGYIVKHYYFDDNLDEYDIGRIFWNGATCMFLRTCKSGDSYLQIWDSCEYEVIGNIHDNPELLKGGEQE